MIFGLLFITTYLSLLSHIGDCFGFVYMLAIFM